jgi:hypothetical protein
MKAWCRKKVMSERIVRECSVKVWCRELSTVSRVRPKMAQERMLRDEAGWGETRQITVDLAILFKNVRCYSKSNMESLKGVKLRNALIR